MLDEIEKLNKYILTLKNNGLRVKDICDGNHSFEDLYEEREALFCALCNTYPNKSWKSKKHYDELNDPMFNDCFIAGLNTENGIISYHFKLKYWDDFLIPEIEKAPKYDDYSHKDVILRLRKFNK